MRLMYRLNGEWVQLFIDSALDRYANLSDLEDIEKAKENLELAKDYWNKQELADGTHESIIHNICIMQDPNARFVTDRDKDNWNNKVDRPISSNEQPENMTDGQMWYNPVTGNISVSIGGDIKNISPIKTRMGSSTFAGNSVAQVITHNCTRADGSSVNPKLVVIMPTGNVNGTLGEYWVQKESEDKKTFSVYNTGSSTVTFDWIAYYTDVDIDI